MTDDEIVYLVTGNHGQSRGTVHTREDCRHLPDDPDRYRDVERAVLGDRFSVCQTCQNGGKQPTSTPWEGGHFQSLLEAAKDGGEIDV
jgi:hypothetical protein